MQLSLFPASLPVASDFYYLEHFRFATEWLRSHYVDLLSQAERSFIDEFPRVPRVSQALLARLIMRKGPLFRATKIHYAEIGDNCAALAQLAERGWIDLQPQLSLDELVPLLRRAELDAAFPGVPRSLTKAEALDLLRPLRPERRRFDEWCEDVDDAVYHLQIAALCTQLRLLFFGNFRQEWAEFVLVELGVFRYETVRLSRRSRSFSSREDRENFSRLYECTRALHAEEPLALVLERLPRRRLRHEWLEARRSKLLYEIGRKHEKAGEYGSALTLYRDSRYPEARLRAIRVLEIEGRFKAAYAAIRRALRKAPSAVETHRLSRARRRLERRLGLPCEAPQPFAQPERMEITLPPPRPGQPIECTARDHLADSTAPVFYVENALINSLFGLLCWEAIFAPVRGSFFHAFQSGPKDLFSARFVPRRRAIFSRCLASLESGCYREIIKENLRYKHSLQSPFVTWSAISPQLVDLALTCIAPVHLRRYFERLLADPAQNRSGLPDLVQFWVHERRYRLIEVKAPCDRVQDNQRQWLNYCLQHKLPVAVCHVRFAARPASAN